MRPFLQNTQLSSMIINVFFRALLIKMSESQASKANELGQQS